ncbi:MAG TPA: heme exporter protein CcmB [Arenicellales bacterium]|nr:heme exporter protein CcmB [Arenicellales bacterium]
MFRAVFTRELQLAYRRRSEWINPLAFFIIVVSLFPLGLAAGPNTLSQIAPGVVWVSALLATLLSLEHMFRSDYEDGALEQFALSTYPLYAVALAKVLAHWMITGLLLCLLSPLLGGALFLEGESLRVLFLSLLLGTPTLSLVGAIGAALTVGLRRGGILLSLLILPLYVPILIFGAGAVDLTANGLDASGQLYLLGALLVLALTLAPFAIGGALRVALE